MRDNPSLQDPLEVQRHFDLPTPVLVEKDWYVVRALAAINAADVNPFRLVFSGGTALSRTVRRLCRQGRLSATLADQSHVRCMRHNHFVPQLG